MTSNMQPFATGAIQSPPDYRDLPLAAVAPVGSSIVSSYFVDISKLPVWNQNKLGACTGHAGAKYKQLLDLRETGTLYQLSARFPYSIAKAMDDNWDEGTCPRYIAKAMKDYGCAIESNVPNDTLLDHETYVYHRKKSNIPVSSFEIAKQFKISGYAFPDVHDANSLKSAILNFSGAMILMKIGKEWWTSKTGKYSRLESDILPLRVPKVTISGHEVYLYGFEDESNIQTGKVRTKFYFLNSWSTDWGQKGVGYFYFDEWDNYLIEAITFVDMPTDITTQLKLLPVREDFRHSFEMPIKLGDDGPEVIALQTALMIDGVFSKDSYASLLSSNALGYYGRITANAVYAYQVKHVVAPISQLRSLRGELVGPATRENLNLWTNL